MVAPKGIILCLVVICHMWAQATQLHASFKLSVKGSQPGLGLGLGPRSD